MPGDAVIDSRLVTLDQVADVALIQMAQPAMRNALTLPMRQALEEALDAANANPGIAAIVLAGGDKVFCAGGDLSTMEGMTPEQAQQRIRLAHSLPRRIHASPKPVVAAVEGICAGAGLSLAAICDLVVSGTEARFVTAFERVGLMPDLGALWSVPARIGQQAARRLFLLGASLNAAEAQELGLSDFLVPRGTALDEAMTLAQRLAQVAPGPLRVVRDTFMDPPATLEAALAQEVRHQPGFYRSQDLSEGITAFRERRDPVWCRD